MSSHICPRISTLLHTRVISAGESESLLTSDYVFELFISKNEIVCNALWAQVGAGERESLLTATIF
mgnify:CR=1 FL=1